MALRTACLLPEKSGLIKPPCLAALRNTSSYVMIVLSKSIPIRKPDLMVMLMNFTNRKSQFRTLDLGPIQCLSADPARRIGNSRKAFSLPLGRRAQSKQIVRHGGKSGMHHLVVHREHENMLEILFEKSFQL